MDNRQLQQKIDTYGDMLFKLSFMRLQSVQDAEDVVQEVFYRYLKHGKEFESEEHEKAWLLRVTMNCCGKLGQSAWKRHFGPNRESVEEQRNILCGQASDPEDAVLQTEERASLLEAVQALPVKYRDVIHLFYYQEFSVKEIAQITGRRVSTVTSQLTRGREMLKKSLKEEYDFE